MAQNYKEESFVSSLYDISGLQDSFSYRAERRAAELASLLVSEDGEYRPFSGPLPESYYSDALLIRHQKKFLDAWNSQIRLQMKRFPFPLSHRRAVVASCLVPLRQRVGSCFATAPAILIHENEPLAYLQDLYDLLTTGRLRRVIAGIEYSVPFSLSSGLGDLRRSIVQPSREIWCSPGLMDAGRLDPQLSWEQKIAAQKKTLSPFLHEEMTVEQLLEELGWDKAAFKAGVDNALLRSWEFTLASLSEVKMEFSRWNLYQSLGLHPHEIGGIGEILYHAIDRELQEANSKAQEFHDESAHAFDQLRMAEKLLSQASTDAEARRLRAEAQGRLHHFQACQELRDSWAAKAEKAAKRFSLLIAQYDSKFPEFFQEIYDPEMVEFGSQVYDDSPAGFRLVYKHGRSDASLWTPIRDADTYIRALVDFFTLTENPEEAHLTSLVIQHIRSESFLRFALQRMARHGKTPWAYISGGTMDTLIKTYFSREAAPTQEARWVESPLDLLIFILDTLKTISPAVMDLFVRDPDRSMLMHSPTHAFLLKPGWSLVREGWQESGFTYTWIRDRFLEPTRAFYAEMTFSKEAQRFLMRQFSVLFEPSASMTVAQLRQTLLGLQCPDVDAKLYSMLPLVPQNRAASALSQLVGAAPPPAEYPEYLTSLELVMKAKDILQGEVIEKARTLGLAPRPFLFADTNWLHSYFAFIVNPGTGEIELWRTDFTGTLGAPMTSWSSYLSGADKTAWVIYTRPHEYTKG